MNVSSADLAICGVDQRESARRSLMWAAGLAVIGAVTAVVIGGARPLIAAAGCMLGAAAGLRIEPRSIAHRAADRRLQLDTSLASYLDLVNVLVAGGSGMETALLAASEAGDGWTFELFRDVLHRSNQTGTPYWEQLRRAGDDLGVTSLVETAMTVQLAGQHGARIRRSLAVRAASLRARQTATLEHAANQTTEHMGLPMVMIFLGFVALLGYPALVTTLGSL